jgi:hypothetical protein
MIPPSLLVCSSPEWHAYAPNCDLRWVHYSSCSLQILRRRCFSCDLLQARAPHLSSKCAQPLAGDADVRCSVHAKRGTERVSVSST